MEPAHQQIATRLGVTVEALDAFVFRRVDRGRMMHLGGYGRAESWAGVVDATIDDEPLLAHAWTTSRPSRQHACGPAQVVGPYWAASAVAVPLPPDYLVVLGSAERLDADDDVVTALGHQIVEHIGEVSPAKRLADELEVLHAVRRVAQITETDVRATADHIVRTAADALSCELGVLWVPDADVLAVVDTVSDVLERPCVEDLTVMMRRLFADRGALPHCQQDNSRRPLPPPLGADGPVVAWYAVPLAGPPDGLLLLCHTLATPRGFTQLCQRVGAHVADAATTSLATALAHRRLQAQLAQATAEARRDALTGLANRRVWFETIADLERDRRRHDTAVVMIDVDRLKQINDEHGHRAGDDTLRAIAGTLVASIRDSDLAARLGGDEFALLLPGTDEQTCRTIVNRIGTAIGRLAPMGDFVPSASIGWAHVAAHDSVDAALRHADLRMYEVKREGRPRASEAQEPRRR